MIEPDMRSYLTASTLTTGAFYLQTAVQNASSPYGVIFKVSPGKNYTHSGSGLSESRIQCSCFADSYYTAKTFAHQVIDAMEVWPSSTSTSAGNVQAVFLAGETDLMEAATRAIESSKYYHVALDFFVWHTY